MRASALASAMHSGYIDLCLHVIRDLSEGIVVGRLLNNILQRYHQLDKNDSEIIGVGGSI